jgi:hypothetical protein
MRPTLDEIYRAGIEALRDRLGRAGMIRFLQQFESGRGDYARDRRKWVDRTTLDDLRATAGVEPPRRRRTTRRKP